MFLSAALKAIAGVDAASGDATGEVIAMIDSIFVERSYDALSSACGTNPPRIERGWVAHIKWSSTVFRDPRVLEDLWTGVLDLH
jgi:hypothetical protein